MTNLGVVETKRFTVLDISNGSNGSNGSNVAAKAVVPAKKEVKSAAEKVEEKKKDVPPPKSGE